MPSWQPILRPVARMMNSRSRRLRPLFEPSLVTLDRQPTQHGEEKLSRGCSSIVRAGAARLIPMPWNWIFPLTHRIPLALILKMAGCHPRPNAFMRS